MSERRDTPLVQLTLARVREFYREPAAVFWVYVFPLLLMFGLGIAFRERPVRLVRVDLVETAENSKTVKALQDELEQDKRLEVRRQPADAWERRLQRGKSDVVVDLAPSASDKPDYQLWHDPNRSESELARALVESALLRPAAGPNAPTISDEVQEKRGGRYIDFLVPGLVGMNLLGGGLWGVGFVIVDMRVRKLLKRFLATPMRRSDFLLSIMFSRLLFMVPDVLALLAFAYFVFGVSVQGSLAALIFLIVLGGACFAGIGLLIASRAKKIETVSGLMNAILLPMWLLSGVFFPYERFPESAHPFIQLLPLTALNDALRAVMLDGKPLTAVVSEIIVLAVWGVGSFAIALRIFRWR